jgi:hypothetical protein
MGLWIALLVVVLALGGLVVVRLTRRKRASSADIRPRREPSRPPRPTVRGDGLAPRIRSLFGAGAGEEDPWARLEELLIKADVGPATASRIVREVRERYDEGVDPVELVANQVVGVLRDGAGLDLPTEGLGVVMVVGVNGSGKTTTIGKLASRLARDGKAVSLAGSDTFRAAASEQLDVWARRSGAHLVTQARGADPSSVRSSRSWTSSGRFDACSRRRRAVRPMRPCSCWTPRQGRMASRKRGRSPTRSR